MKLTIPPFVEETAVDNSQMINLSVSSLKPTWSLSVSCSSLVWPCSRTVLPSPFSPKTLWKQGSVFKHASAQFNGIPQAQRHEEEKVLQNTIARCWNEHGSLFMCKVLCSVCVCVCSCLSFCSCEKLLVLPHVRSAAPPHALPRTSSFVVTGIYCDVAAFLAVLHASHSFSQGHMEEEESLVIKN